MAATIKTWQTFRTPENNAVCRAVKAGAAPSLPELSYRAAATAFMYRSRSASVLIKLRREMWHLCERKIFVSSFGSWLISPRLMEEDRKTLEQRTQMTELERLRHSASHVLATAILKIWPEAQFAAGPPVENGFYYDVDLPHRISPEDFEKIEVEMEKEIEANHPFERVEVSRDEALALGKKGRLAALGNRPEPSRYKIDIIENIPPDEKISLYRNGNFIDLSAGPHVNRTGEIGAFKLTNVASAYYKGDEKNPQLQRVYGTALKRKKELEEYFAMLEEAKKRDHRKLGKELELFVFDDDVGPGLPMFLPRGAVIADELETLAKETEFAAGYQRVRTPHIARESLYKKSGHLPYYAESMFPPMELPAHVESLNRDSLNR